MDIKLTPAMLYLWSGMQATDKSRLLDILLAIARGHETDIGEMPEEMTIIIEEVTKTAIKDSKAEKEKSRQHEKYIRTKAAKAAETVAETQQQKKPDVNDVLRIAAETGAKCYNTEDAELYINSRERYGWKINGNPILNFVSDIKAFFLSKESNERARRGFNNKEISQDYSKGLL